MHQSLTLMERAIALAEEEYRLLDTEDCEGLQESATQRADYIQRAWKLKSECPADIFMDKLRAFQTIQLRLTEKAKTRLAETKKILKESKPNLRAIHGYAHRPRRTELAMMVAKTS